MKTKFYTTLLLFMAIALFGYAQTQGTYPKSVFVNGFITDGVELNASNPYFKNGDTPASRSGSASNYNAYYNPTTGVLELKGYNSGTITAMQDYSRNEPYNFKLVKVNVVSNSTITTTSGTGIDFTAAHQVILSADSAVVTLFKGASLNINVNNSSSIVVRGIYTSKSLTVTSEGTGQGKVNIDVTGISASSPQVFGISAGSFYLRGNTDLSIKTHGANNSVIGGGCGMFADNYMIDCNGDILIDASSANIFSYGVFNNFIGEYSPMEIVRFKTFKIKAMRAGTYGGVSTYNQGFLRANYFMCGYEESDNGQTNGLFEKTYTMKPTIFEVSVTVTEPKVGDHPSTTLTAKTPGYNITDVSWWINNSQVMNPSTYQFLDNSEYDLRFWAEVKNGYALANEKYLKFFVNGKEGKTEKVFTEIAMGSYTFKLYSTKKGDVNQDGSVNINDVVAIINVMAGTAAWPNANVNGDSKVDINDVVAVINIMAGV